MSDYSEKVLDHFRNPRNIGELIDADGFGQDGTPDKGPAMQFWVNLNGVIIDKVTFKAYGCGAAIACCSILTEIVVGLHINNIIQVTSELITEELGGLPLGKYHCPKMAIAAFKQAVENASTFGI